MKTDVKGVTTEHLLSLIPHQPPFRFVSEISEVSEKHIVGSYFFHKNEFFYQGHFPDQPITPGVILWESMCQIGVVALGIYLMSLEYDTATIGDYRTVFTDGVVEFFAPVFPETSVQIRGEKVFWRQKKIRSKIEMYAGSVLVATAAASGIGVRR